MLPRLDVDPDSKKIGPCTVLGGAGYPLFAGDIVELRFGPSMVEITRDQAAAICIQYVEVVDIAVSGPGVTATGWFSILRETSTD